jgi:hypothetical protein
MASLVPATDEHPCGKESMDGRHKGGHDEVERATTLTPYIRQALVD